MRFCPLDYIHVMSRESDNIGFSTFSSCVSIFQPPGWIKMPLGTKVGLGPGHTVLHSDPAPPQNGGGALGTAPANFRPMSIVAKWSSISATGERRGANGREEKGIEEGK